MSGADRGPFVVVAGIPGAGKTTALRELADTHPHDAALVLDSDSVRRSLQARLPGVPYRILRPLVHLVHWSRIAALAASGTGPLLIHETATRPLSRGVLLRIARLTRRPARMVWIDVDADTARRGQLARDRVIRPGSFRRHVRRVDRCDPPVAVAGAWDMVRRTDRTGAVLAIRAATQTAVPVVRR